MRHLKYLTRLIGGALLACVGCSGGTEADNPSVLDDFATSTCKTRTDAAPQGIILSSEADGLQCVEWEVKANGGLRVRLLNFPEPCGEQYFGSASVAADGTLALEVYKSDCNQHRCGNCVFDFDFDLTGVPIDAPLAVRIGTANCREQPTTFSDELTLPLAEAESGLICRPLERSALDQVASARQTCGARNMPCGGCAGVDGGACAAGLACTDIGSFDQRCLTPCQTDADCQPRLTYCRAGACQAVGSW